MATDTYKVVMGRAASAQHQWAKVAKLPPLCDAMIAQASPAAAPFAVDTTF